MDNPENNIPVNQDRAEIIIYPQQIKDGIINDDHLAPMNISSGTSVADHKIKIKINGKFYYINCTLIP